MILTAAMILTSGVTQAAVGADPSLYTPHAIYDAPIATMSTSIPAKVLDSDGTKIHWDDTAEEFDAWLDGSGVTDLVTGTDAAGNSTFEGKFDTNGDPALFGTFIPGSSSDEYTVEVTTPGDKPHRYEVTNVTGIDPAVDVAEECDCADNIDLGCKTSECHNNSGCPNHDWEQCEWQNVQ